MARESSGVLKTLGILHLIGGGLGLIASLCSGAALLFTQAMLSNMPNSETVALRQRMLQLIPSYQAFELGELLLGLAFDVALIMAGLGLLQQQHWARIVSLAWAIPSIINKIIVFCYQAFIVFPVTERFYLEQAARMPAGQAAGFNVGVKFGFFGALVVQLLFIIYPITVFILLLLPSVVASFGRAQPRQSRRPEQDHEDDLDR